MSGTYSDVDASSDPAFAVKAQEIVDSWPEIQVYKRHTRQALARCAPVLDLGCGPGLDLVDLAGDGTPEVARAIGVDASLTMCLTARARAGPYVVVGDGAALPFADSTFGGVRADRVLQHVRDPDACLREMARVCRSGGRIVVADPDQETLTISVPGVPRQLTDRVKALRRDHGYRHGRLVTSLPERLEAMGCTGVDIRAFPLILTRADLAFGLPGWPRLWRDRGGFSDDEIELWERAVAASPVVYALLYFTVTATLP